MLLRLQKEKYESFFMPNRSLPEAKREFFSRVITKKLMHQICILTAPKL